MQPARNSAVPIVCFHIKCFWVVGNVIHKSIHLVINVRVCVTHIFITYIGTVAKNAEGTQ